MEGDITNRAGVDPLRQVRSEAESRSIRWVIYGVIMPYVPDRRWLHKWLSERMSCDFQIFIMYSPVQETKVRFPAAGLSTQYLDRTSPEKKIDTPQF